MTRCLLGALLLLTPSLFAQQTKASSSFLITGIVVNARDNSPVPHCHMTASLVASGRNASRDPVRADTDESGRFSLDVPSVGNWQVSANAHNIRNQQFDEHEGFFTGVILTSAAPTYDLVFHAVPDAILQGTVTDEAGEPVRNAQVTLFFVNPAASQTGSQPLQQRQGTQTDDRGHYELASLESGQYMVQVQTRPWYASANGPGTRNAGQSPSASPDPSLDVVYPTTWYPGVPDSSAAGLLTAHPGDTLQADFRMSPMPSAHLLIPSREPPLAQPNRPGRNGEGSQTFRQNPSITMLLPNGLTQGVFGQFSRNEAGDVDISGIAPGTYQVTMPGSPETPGASSIVRIASGGATTELGSPTPTSAVTIAVDGGTNAGASQIVLRSTTTGQLFSASDRMGGDFRGERPPGGGPTQNFGPQTAQNRGVQASQRSRGGNPPSGPGARVRSRAKDGDEVTVQVPPGTYEVTLQAANSIFITGVAAKGASVRGQTITVPESPISLTVHLASGLAIVEGRALLAGKPAASAMILLIPATLGDLSSMTIVRRDQTNTDGSFQLDGVLPGQYILLAIAHGWSVHWTDPETLRPYLMHGIPLDLHPAARLSQQLTALTP